MEQADLRRIVESFINSYTFTFDLSRRRRDLVLVKNGKMKKKKTEKRRERKKYMAARPLDTPSLTLNSRRVETPKDSTDDRSERLRVTITKTSKQQ